MEPKQALLKALQDHLASEIATMRRLALDAADAATHEDNRPESDKDMRSTEASYLARGQATRVLDLERDLSLIASMQARAFAPGEAAASGALVTVRHQGKNTTYLLVPTAGGVSLSAGGLTAQSLAIQSPLGAALLSLSEGDEAELEGPRNTQRVYEILSVR